MAKVRITIDTVVETSLRAAKLVAPDNRDQTEFCKAHFGTNEKFVEWALDHLRVEKVTREKGGL